MTDHLEAAFRRAREQTRRNRRHVVNTPAKYTEAEFNAIVADIAYEGEVERVMAHHEEPSYV